MSDNDKGPYANLRTPWVAPMARGREMSELKKVVKELTKFAAEEPDERLCIDVGLLLADWRKKADEIARLRCKTFVSQEAEIARLKAVLEDVLKFSNDPGVIRFVRAALEEK